MSDNRVEPGPVPERGAMIISDNWPKVFIPWDEIPDLITKLRRAYNDRPTERQEK